MVGRTLTVHLLGYVLSDFFAHTGLVDMMDDQVLWLIGDDAELCCW